MLYFSPLAVNEFPVFDILYKLDTYIKYLSISQMIAWFHP